MLLTNAKLFGAFMRQYKQVVTTVKRFMKQSKQISDAIGKKNVTTANFCIHTRGFLLFEEKCLHTYFAKTEARGY